MQSDLYFLLGIQNNTYFFIHTVASTEFQNEISHQIYNVLISNKQIVDKESNVIIYEFPLDGSCHIVSISHSNRLIKPIYTLANLETFLPILLRYSQETTNMIVIEYDYIIGGYKSFCIPEKIVLTEIPNERLKIDGIEYVYTTKEL
jgi:hypothetical protein